MSAKHALFGLILCKRLKQTNGIQKRKPSKYSSCIFQFTKMAWENICLFWCQQIGQITKSEKSEGIVRNPVFFFIKQDGQPMNFTYILTSIFLTVKDGSLQRYVSEFVVKSQRHQTIRYAKYLFLWPPQLTQKMNRSCEHI